MPKLQIEDIIIVSTVGDCCHMFDHAPQLLIKFRYMLLGVAILLSFLLLSAFLTAVKPSAPYTPRTMSDYVPSESSNVVSSGMSEFTYELSTLGESIKQACVASLITVTEAAEAGRKLIGSAAAVSFDFSVAILKGMSMTVGSILGFTANMAVSGLVGLLEVPGSVLSFLGNTAVMGSVIRPADHAQVPLIDPESPALLEAKTAISPIPTPGQTQPTETPMWPIRGEVTTRFGVKHWPYQATHTGIDISDGKRAGVTPIYPFKSGIVVFAGRGSNGLGNHVILDHGNGVTSVYAHLSTINVGVGQSVNQAIVLGTEGSTGVSTGTHLHFEIRVNGMAADPAQFIAGLPH